MAILTLFSNILIIGRLIGARGSGENLPVISRINGHITQANRAALTKTHLVGNRGDCHLGTHFRRCYIAICAPFKV